MENEYVQTEVFILILAAKMARVKGSQLLQFFSGNGNPRTKAFSTDPSLGSGWPTESLLWDVNDVAVRLCPKLLNTSVSDILRSENIWE